MSKRYTVMVVPDRSSRVRRMRVSRRTLWGVVSFVIVLVLAVVAGAFHYFSIVDQVRENSHLRRQNLELRNKLVNLHNKVASIQSILDRVQRFDTKLRAITQLSDPKRHLALGPFASRNTSESVFDSDGAVDPLVQAIGEKPHLAVQLIGERLDEVASEGEKREGSIRDIDSVLGLEHRGYSCITAVIEQKRNPFLKTDLPELDERVAIVGKQ